MIQALNDFVILSYDKKKDDKNSIIISDVSKERSAVMKVEGAGKLATQVKKGDRVVLSPFAPQAIKVEGKEYFVLKEKEIFCILQENGTNN